MRWHPLKIESPDLTEIEYQRRTKQECRREFYYLRRNMAAIKPTFWQRAVVWLDKPVRWNDWS